MLIPLPPGYRAETIGPALLVARADAAGVLRAAIETDGTVFAHARTRSGGGAVRSGRGPLATLTAAGEEWIVRHARRGGAVAPILGDRYLRVGTPRPVRELLVSHAARSAGIATPQVVAVAVYTVRPRFYRGDVITARLPGAVDLARVLFGRSTLMPDDDAADVAAGDGAGAEPDPWLAARAAGAAVRAAFERGLVHPDLNLKNVLVRQEADGVEAWIIDFDGCRISPLVRERRRAAMLSRFERSWSKWRRHAGEPRAPLSVFRAGYAGLPAHRGGAE